MTSFLFFSSRLCFKCLKKLSYSCHCLLTHVCLLCMSKVCRKKFHCLLTCGFLQQFTSAYLSVKWIINFLSFLLKILFSSSLTSSLLLFVCEIFLNWIFQHWLSYNKLSSNNNNNNYHHVSVIQVCVSELITCKALILYNTYVAALAFTDTDADSFLLID